VAGKLAPKQIAQAGATAGQVMTWSAGNNRWEPGNTGAALGMKAGSVLNASFTGNPKKANVTFITPYANTNYAISFSEYNSVSGSAHNITIENKATTGFTINTNTNNVTNMVEIMWQSQTFGEQ